MKYKLTSPQQIKWLKQELDYNSLNKNEKSLINEITKIWGKAITDNGFKW